MSKLDDMLKKEDKKDIPYLKPIEGDIEPIEPIDIQDEVDQLLDDTEQEIREKKSYSERVKERLEKDKEKLKPKKKDKPVYNKDTDIFTKEERFNLKKKFAKGKERKERKRIMKGENSGVFDRQKFYLALFSISIFSIFMLYYYSPENEAILAIVLLLGAGLFLPIGMIFGWMVLDPFMRCKIARKLTKRNFGIINFVAKGKKIISKMKNFDEDLIWIKNKCWAITKEGIYEIDKTGERINDGEVIDPDGVLTITETVPVMFIDLVSMQPLAFKSDQREGIAPEELGSTLKGWVDNQMAKVMFLKKTLDMYFVIVILSCIASAYLSYDNMTKLEVITEELQTIKDMIASIPHP